MTHLLWRMVAQASADGSAAGERFPRPEAGVDSYVPGDAPPDVVAAAADGTCPACRTPVPRMKRVQPVVVVWPDGEPDEVGDFVWPVGTYLPVTSRRVASELRERFTGFELGPVADEPGLAEVWITARRRPHERSTLREVHPPCPVCGTSILMWGASSAFEVARRWRKGLVLLEGVEFWDSGDWDPAIKDLARIHHQREPGRGLFVADDERDGSDLFYIGDDNKAIICTDEVKAFVEERGWTNVGFLAAGETI